MPIQVLSVDDHDVAQLGLVGLFETSTLRLQATARSPAEAIDKLEKRRPDVVLTEALDPIGMGIDLLKQIKAKWPSQPVVFFSGTDSPSYMARAYASGAAGYVSKGDQSSRLIDVVSRAAAGEMVWTKDQLKPFNNRFPVDPDGLLTAREREIVPLLSHGLTNDELAAVLQIGYETAREHVKSILRKLGFRHRVEAAVWAVRQELGRSEK